MNILAYMQSEVTSWHAAGTSEGAMKGWDTRGRRPTERESDHEHMRISNAAQKGKTVEGQERILLQRLNAIKNPQKLYNFHQALEDENLHSFISKHVLPKMIDMGWNGRHPSE